MFLSDDYSQLYFTSTRNEAQGSDLNGVTGTKSADIFFSEKNDKGKWSKPEAIGTGLNTDYEEGACCFTPDGKQMYLTPVCHRSHFAPLSPDSNLQPLRCSLEQAYESGNQQRYTQLFCPSSHLP